MLLILPQRAIDHSTTSARLVEGPGDVYICGECIELCQSILDQERAGGERPSTLFTDIPSPREIVGKNSINT
jgi:ATP-dependent protease Clp ATPase subunit